MLTFFTDESLVLGRGSQKYGLSIYGGLILEEDCLEYLTDFFYKLKDRYVLPQELELKWRFQSVWENMKKIKYISQELTRTNNREAYDTMKNDYNKLKEEVLEVVAGSSAKIIIAIRPNKLLRTTTEKNIEYSIRSVTKKFRKILGDENEFGIIFADELMKRLDEDDLIDYQYILKLCCDNPNPNSADPLYLIVPTIDSCISPMHQINDIVLGAIQYYMLEFMRILKDDSWNMDEAKRLLKLIIKKFYKSKSGGYIINNGILLYPPKNKRQLTRAGIFLNKLEDQLQKDFNIN